MNIRIHYAVIFTSAFCLSACTTTGAGSQKAGFGDAVKGNIAAHALTPTDAEKNNTYIPADRRRQALALERYKNNEVTPPAAMRTTDETE